MGLNWLRVKDWSERARDQQQPEAQARRLYQAVTDPVDGVFPWIKRHW